MIGGLIPSLRNIKKEFTSPHLKNISLLSHDKFIFLNKSASLQKIGWNGNDQIPKLWRYNQHYFDYLTSKNYLKCTKWHEKILENWINENKLGQGFGWDSYPTSLRIVNWIKWHLLGNFLSNNCMKSLAIQARWLNKRVEWHILGNHLFSNAKALLFVGLFFSSKESDIWIRKALTIIDREIEEQILNDGGHFELSPMYHNLFLEDLLDLINISRTYSNVINDSKIELWKSKALKMLRWAESMSHPDGDISFFNDSCLGIAPKIENLIDYAKKLDIKYSLKKFQKITSLSDSGYIRITSKNLFGVLDVARIGPDYLPGHAHADTLSFELSFYGKRIFVNGGISGYESNNIRQYERSTKAHNTLTINNQNSSEVWKSFRVAKRAYPTNLEIVEDKKTVHVSCAHDGYSRLIGKPMHQRNWQISDYSLIIRDRVKGFFNFAYSYFHFHPSINLIRISDTIYEIKMSKKELITLEVIEGQPFIETSYYASEFGKRCETQCLKIELDKKMGSSLKISWKN